MRRCLSFFSNFVIYIFFINLYFIWCDERWGNVIRLLLLHGHGWILVGCQLNCGIACGASCNSESKRWLFLFLFYFIRVHSTSKYIPVRIISFDQCNHAQTHTHTRGSQTIDVYATCHCCHIVASSSSLSHISLCACVCVSVFGRVIASLCRSQWSASLFQVNNFKLVSIWRETKQQQKKMDTHSCHTLHQRHSAGWLNSTVEKCKHHINDWLDIQKSGWWCHLQEMWKWTNSRQIIF